MTWFTRIDRFGDTHLCFAQSDTDSCGLACSKMIVFKVNKLRPGASALTTESKVETIYKKYDATAVHVGSEGVFFDLMHKVLNELNIGTWAHAAPGNQDIPAFLTKHLPPDTFGLGLVNTITRKPPMMLKVQWGGGAAHAVVVDTITRIPGSSTLYAAICDPGDGDVHITGFEIGQQINYRGRQVTYSVNVWGTPKHSYAAGTEIQGVVTEVVYCTKAP